MAIQPPKLWDVVRRHSRYAYEAYEFVFAALDHTLARMEEAEGRSEGREPGQGRHVSGQELLDGIRDLALREFGLMARTVFRLWGVERTDDFGEIVFQLVDAHLLSVTEQDSREDFHNVYDLDEALVRDFRIELPEPDAEAELSQ
ncbi:MAG TPA: Minf_1886 family protein [Gemmataceae bacterium]|nr:Minf_1886 family protein [Gemmataceae bacterium]